MLYFDHSATTPIHKEVIEVMNKADLKNFGNPSSTHQWGQNARNIVENARNKISKAIGCTPYEIIFTGGGTESNNLVLYNLLYSKNKHVITSEIEHPAILNVLKRFKQFGIESSILKVDKSGIINPNDIKKTIRENTGLISIMFANNEIGSIQPLKEISEIAIKNNIPFHSDGVQALGKIPVNVNSLGVDMMSFTGHKFYGPKGIGALFLKNNTKLKSFILGGGQERNLRAGTENVSGIAGFGEAAELATVNLKKTVTHLKNLEEVFKKNIKNYISDIIFNSPLNKLPGLISLTIPSIDNSKLIIGLNRKGIAISSGSACSSGTISPSHVLKAIGLSNNYNLKTLRISFGIGNSEKDTLELVEAISSIVNS